MPFREVTEFARARGLVERWLRRIFVDNWSLKLLALAITLVLWFVVTGQEPIERELVVEPRIEGTVAPAYEVKEVIATPNKIRVRGPASHVNVLQKAPTATISIEGRRDSFDAPGAPIYIPDPKVEILDDAVNVHVSIVAVGNPKPKPRDTN